MGLLDALLSNNSGGGLFDSLFYPTSAPDAGAEKKKQDAAFLAALGQDPYQGVSNPNATPTFQASGGGFPINELGPTNIPALAGTNAGAYGGGSSPFGLGGFNLPAASQGAPASGAFPAVPAMQSPQASQAPQVAPQMPQMAPPPQMGAPAPQNGPSGSMNIGGYQMPQFGNRADYTPQAGAPSTDISAQSRQPQPDQSQGLPPALQPRDFLSRIGNPDGLIARLTGNDSRSVAQQNLRATFDATRAVLLQSGMSNQEATSKAMLAVLNPEAGKTILPEALSNKQDIKLIKNDFGGEVPYAYDKISQKLTPLMPGSGAGGTSGDLGAISQKISTMRENGAPREQLIKQIPQAYQADVEALVTGKAVPANMGRSAIRGTLITLAHQVDPLFDESLIPTRVAMRKDFAGEGKNGQSIGALNTVQHHADQVSDAISEFEKAGGGSNSPLWNASKLMLANNTGYDPQLRDAAQKLKDKLNATEHEVASAYNAGHLSDHDLKTWNEIKAENLPAGQLKQKLADFVDLLNGKRDSLNHMYRTTFGEDAPGIDKETNVATTDKIHQRLPQYGGNAASASGGIPSGWTVRQR